jgi:hypothetical protein
MDELRAELVIVSCAACGAEFALRYLHHRMLQTSSRVEVELLARNVEGPDGIVLTDSING